MIRETLKKTLIGDMFRHIRLNKFIRQWKKENMFTMPKLLFNTSNVIIKRHSYGDLNIISFNNYSNLYIGDFVSIAQNVVFLLDVEHAINTISTYPFKAKIMNLGDEAFSKGDIVIDDDVWIGYGSTILSGVHIGQGAVIAAGSVVTKDVPAYSVVGGIPAKMIKYRFSKDVIEYMLSLDYSQLSDELIYAHINALYTKLDNLSLVEIKELLNWFPSKK